MYSLRNLAWTLGIPVEVLRIVARNAVHYYRPFKEHSKGKVREIDNPNYNLKSIQKRIEINLLKKFQLPDYLHGGISGRSAVTNARTHQGRSYVARLDVKNFYPSVKHKDIYKLWVSLGYGPSVSRVLTALTTYRGHLPQGAPTSTCLGNLVLLGADAEIKCVALKQNISYTRFVDDLIFSGKDPFSVLEVAIRALHRAGFQVSRKKLQIMPASKLQEVTGYGVNEISDLPRIPKKKRSRVRSAIHDLKGRKLELDPLDSKYKQCILSIEGRIRHIQDAHPGEAKRLFRYLSEVKSSAEHRARCGT